MYYKFELSNYSDPVKCDEPDDCASAALQEYTAQIKEGSWNPSNEAKIVAYNDDDTVNDSETFSVVLTEAA